MAVTLTHIPKGFYEVASPMQLQGWSPYPVGHFTVPHRTMLARGWAEIKADAERRMKELEDAGTIGPHVQQYYTWYAFSICMEAGQIFCHRYGELAAQQAAECTDPARKAELEQMAANLEQISVGKAQTFWQAVQLVYLYQELVLLDAQMHGTSFGRLDTALAPFYENDIADGTLEPEWAQEIIDALILKIAENNKVMEDEMTRTNPGYTTGQMITLGGVDSDGRDSTSEVTYMILESSARLKLHDPSQAVRIHKHTPEKLWAYVISCNQINGGVPTIQNDDVIIPCLMQPSLNYSLADARDYAIVGCMEPAGNGNDWPSCGGSVGAEGSPNLPRMLLRALFDGHDILGRNSMDDLGPQAGPNTGYFSDMDSMDDLWDAVMEQIDFHVRWYANNTSAWEYAYRDNLPVPIASAAIEGCMESGLDASWGGAKYNSNGLIGLGVGNLADSLQMIEHLVFKEKMVTKEELMDCLLKNWEGYEDLHYYVLNKAPHYGNGDPEADKYLKWVADHYAQNSIKYRATRGNFKAGLWSVTSHIVLGMFTPATPDGRFKGQALAESTAPVQGMDKSGPLAMILSVTGYDQSQFGNGTALNMKFHPATISTPEACDKLRDLIQTYFDRDGMQMQFNIAGADTMREAQENPEEYHDLVVRIAGFSAYFVEMGKDAQDELIERTVHSL